MRTVLDPVKALRNKRMRKIVDDLFRLRSIVEEQRRQNKRIVVTIGSWDLLHIGHCRYLERASWAGDVLVVGVDSDEVVRRYKGEGRPIVPETERAEMLTNLSFVDFITYVRDADDKGVWLYELIRQIRPDVFVAVEDSYPPDQQRDIELLCGELAVLPRQAEDTSTTDVVQRIMKTELLPRIAELETKKAKSRRKAATTKGGPA